MDDRQIAEELLEIHGELNRRRLHQKMNGFGRGEIFALSCLYDHGGSAWPKELSEDMGVSSARVAALVNQLEGKGWVRREGDFGDTRHTVVSLTGSGRAAVLAEKEEILDSIMELLEGLGHQDAEAFLRIRRKMLDLSPDR